VSITAGLRRLRARRRARQRQEIARPLLPAGVRIIPLAEAATLGEPTPAC
jgi:hypothetical protein